VPTILHLGFSEEVVCAGTPVADPAELHLPRLPKSSGLGLGPMYADPSVAHLDDAV